MRHCVRNLVLEQGQFANSDLVPRISCLPLYCWVTSGKSTHTPMERQIHSHRSVLCLRFGVFEFTHDLALEFEL